MAKKQFPPEWYAAQAARRKGKGLEKTSSAPFLNAKKSSDSFRKKVEMGDSAYMPKFKNKKLKNNLKILQIFSISLRNKM